MTLEETGPARSAGNKKVKPPRSAGFYGQFVSWAGKLVTSPMNPGIKPRLVVFISAIALVFTAILWTAHTSWQRIRELRERLTSVQLESFIIAEHFQKSILELNNLLLKYEIRPQPQDWVEFIQKSTELNQWIDQEKPKCRSEREIDLLGKLDQAYDGYLGVATNLQVASGMALPASDALQAFSSVKKETDNLLRLGIQLADAHRATLDAFLNESDASLRKLRAVLFSSLCLLLVFGLGLAAITYRDLIAPLRVKLVESRALLERQEKLASLGMLAAGVAHEIRNPLTAIKARLFTQQKVLKPNTPEHADARVIGQEINRLERIVKDFLLFARPSDPERCRISATQPLHEVEALLGKQLQDSGVRLSVDGSDEELLIEVDPQQIQQVLINLVQNAADAIGRNGWVSLRARSDQRPLNGRIQPVVVLEVADTGKGIAPDVEKRLFDPFFTTKDAGTGLGLPIAARIVQKHGGAVQYQTQVGHGTTFGIVLPRAEAHSFNRSDPAD
jgi:signal transduction histidine kinase